MSLLLKKQSEFHSVNCCPCEVIYTPNEFKFPLVTSKVRILIVCKCVVNRTSYSFTNVQNANRTRTSPVYAARRCQLRPRKLSARSSALIQNVAQETDRGIVRVREDILHRQKKTKHETQMKQNFIGNRRSLPALQGDLEAAFPLQRRLRRQTEVPLLRRRRHPVASEQRRQDDFDDEHGVSLTYR